MKNQYPKLPNSRNQAMRELLAKPEMTLYDKIESILAKVRLLWPSK